MNGVAARREEVHSTGLFVFLSAVAMLFAAFTAAYLVRRTGTDWRRVALPDVTWGATGVLLASSLTMEAARRTMRPAWFRATLALGILFLGLQFLAWRNLAAAGAFLPTRPHASFFYVLTGVHGAHLLGGLAALGFLAARPSRPRAGLCAAYWHCVDGLWAYAFFLLKVL